MQISAALDDVLTNVPANKTVLIAGPTASGKSALALAIAERQGGVIVNADASQVYDCWRVITARPSIEEEAQATHLLYGHISAETTYSTGHWLREVAALLQQDQKLIIVGGTGLYFSALTLGLVDIPATPADVRLRGDELELTTLLDAIDPVTLARIDIHNRARVQRAWEVQQATGKGLAAWQDTTPPPALAPEDTHRIVFDVDPDWLNRRIVKRFDLMLDQGALKEVAAVRPAYDPNLPAHRAIGVPELIAHLDGVTSIDEARERSIIATRQFAKRQRTWMRSKMSDWQKVTPD